MTVECSDCGEEIDISIVKKNNGICDECKIAREEEKEEKVNK
jgi:hypothetical protein